MATKIRGITIELNGDTTGLEKSLKSVNSSIRDTQSQLKDVNRLLKLDPSNTELVAQKQRLLKDAINETNEKLKALKEAEKMAAAEAENGGEKEQKAYEAIQREIVQTEQNLKKLVKEQEEFTAKTSSLGKVAEKFGEIGNKATELGNKLMPVSAAAAAAEAALFGVAVKAAGAADDLNTMSKQTGISTEELQKLQYASDIVDVSVETMKSSLGKMTSTLRSNSGAFSELGVAINDSTGKMRSRYDIFVDTIDALSKITDETERDMKSQELFGRSFQELNPLIADGADALRELGKEAEDLNLVVDQETLDKANQLNDSIDKIKATFKAVVTKIGAELAPVFNAVLDGLKEKIAGVGNAIATFIGDHPGFTKLMTALLGITAAAAPVLLTFGKISDAVKDSITSFASLGNNIMKVIPMISGISAPVVAVVAAIGALAAAFATLWKTNEEFRENVIAIWDGVKAKFEEFGQGIVERLNALGFSFKDITEVIKAVWEGFCNFLAPIFEGAFNLISTILGTVLDVLTGLFDVFSGIFTGNWELVWTGIKEIFEGIWNLIKGFFETILNTIKGIFDEVLHLMGTSWDEAWTSIKNFFVNIWNDIKGFVQYTIPAIINDIINWFSQLPSRIWDWLSNAANKVVQWGSNLASNARNAASNLVNSFINGVSSLPGRMWDWATDAIDNFVGGIRSAIWRVADAASSVASTVASYLHFSEPDVGPLSNASTFMPDMMRLFADGIKDNIPLIEDAVGQVATVIEGGFDRSSAIIDIINDLAGLAGVQFSMDFGTAGLGNALRDIIGIYNSISGFKQNVQGFGDNLSNMLLTTIFGLSTSEINSLKNIKNEIVDGAKSIIEKTSLLAEEAMYPVLSAQREMLALRSLPANMTNTVNVNFGGITWAGQNDIEQTMEMIGTVTKRRGYRLA